MIPPDTPIGTSMNSPSSSDSDFHSLLQNNTQPVNLEAQLQGESFRGM